jgi:hypothetical protein
MSAGEWLGTAVQRLVDEHAITLPVSFDDSLTERQPAFPLISTIGRIVAVSQLRPVSSGKRREITNREEIEHLIRGLYSSGLCGDLPAVRGSFFPSKWSSE